ncbi:MAG: hypothetical protein H0T53_15585 [Herpetosiphonaceae bacterium]|nr:hypothetical protein [Herpetosiphonaceae bacterium]
MDTMIPQTAMTLFAAIEILATGTEGPEDRLRSAWMRLQAVQATALPERLQPRYHDLLQRLTTLLPTASEPRPLPVSRLDYIEVSTALCTLYRQLCWP